MEIVVGGVKLRTYILQHRDADNDRPDHFALYLICYALTLFIFVLENIPKPKRQYVMLDDEDEVNRECCIYHMISVFEQFIFFYIVGLSRRENKYFWEVNV